MDLEKGRWGREIQSMAWRKKRRINFRANTDTGYHTGGNARRPQDGGKITDAPTVNFPDISLLSAQLKQKHQNTIFFIEHHDHDSQHTQPIHFILYQVSCRATDPQVLRTKYNEKRLEVSYFSILEIYISGSFGISALLCNPYGEACINLYMIFNSILFI